MITGIAHVNLTVPPGTLDQAAAFYGDTLGLTRVPVPVLQKDRLAWFVLPPLLPLLSPPSSSISFLFLDPIPHPNYTPDI